MNYQSRKFNFINEHARLAKRDLKNVAEDVNYLSQMGLIEKKATKREIAPSANYDKIKRLLSLIQSAKEIFAIC